MSFCSGQTNVLACIYLKLFSGLSCSSTRTGIMKLLEEMAHYTLAVQCPGWALTRRKEMRVHGQEQNSDWAARYQCPDRSNPEPGLGNTSYSKSFTLSFFFFFFSEGFTATAFAAIARPATHMKTRNTRLQDPALTPGKPASNMQQAMKGSKLCSLP